MQKYKNNDRSGRNLQAYINRRIWMKKGFRRYKDEVAVADHFVGKAAVLFDSRISDRES
jgi:hypothetical protein